MKKSFLMSLAFGLLVTGVTGLANASLTTYFNRTNWEIAVSNPVVETFNGLSENEFHTSLDLNGVNFTTTDLTTTTIIEDNLWVASFADPENLFIVGSQGGSNIKVTLSEPKKAVAAEMFTWMYDADINVRVTVADNNGLTTYALAIGPYSTPGAISSSTVFPGNFFGVITDTGFISSIDFIVNSPESDPPNNYWQSIGIDNFSYGNAVPVPSAILLLASGILGLAGMNRRKK